MAVEDSLPERRNLSVLSLAFIAYYYGGGSIADEHLQLEVVNITFTNGPFLGVMVWLMMFWFLIRYWQTTRGALAREFHQEMQRNGNTLLARRYLERHYKREPNDTRSGFIVSGISAPAQREKSITFAPSDTGGSVEGMPLEGADGRWAYRSVVLRTALVGKALGSYAPPYFLALFAIAGPWLRDLFAP